MRVHNDASALHQLYAMTPKAPGKLARTIPTHPSPTGRTAAAPTRALELRDLQRAPALRVHESASKPTLSAASEPPNPHTPPVCGGPPSAKDGNSLSTHAGEPEEPLSLLGLVAAWGKRDARYDFTGDGVVNTADLLHWLRKHPVQEPVTGCESPQPAKPVDKHANDVIAVDVMA